MDRVQVKDKLKEVWSVKERSEYEKEQFERFKSGERYV